MKKIIIHAMSVICIASSTVFIMNASEQGSASGSQSNSLTPSPEHSPRSSRKQETSLTHAHAVTQLHQHNKEQKKEHHSVLEQPALKQFVAEFDEKEHQLKNMLHEKTHNIAEGLHLLKSDDEEPLHATQIHDDVTPIQRTATPIPTPATPRAERPAHISGFGASASHTQHPAASSSKPHATKALAPHLSHAPAATHSSPEKSLVKKLEQDLSKVETKIEQEVSKIEKEIEGDTNTSHDQTSASHPTSNPITAELKKDAQKIETKVAKIETEVKDEIKKEETKIEGAISGKIEDKTEAAAAADALSWWQKNASSLKIAGISVTGIIALIAALYHFDCLPAGVMQKLDACLPQFLAKSTGAIHHVA